MSKWKLCPKINSLVSKKLSDYPIMIRQLLFNRGIKTKEEAEKFLDKNYVKFYNPSKIYQIEKTAKLILDFARKGKKIFIHGDFDVDGICATSILWDFLYRELEADVLPYIPSRFDEGYGMSDASLSRIKEQGGELVITVDCGIKDDELISKWSKKGLQFIVTDHHELKKVDDEIILPKKALAIVHPRHPKGKYPFKEISGATVVWKLVSVIRKVDGLDFDTDAYLDLVALSTVCDIMPVISENRSILKSGLKQIRKTERAGLRRLIYDAGFKPVNIDTYHIGFVIGPRLNAAGRLDHAIDAVKLLVTKSGRQAREISEKLNQLNQKRQRIQDEIYKNAIKQIKKVGTKTKLYFVWGEDWAEGVIGIVAGKISGMYNRPVLIATRKGGEYTGSARSIDRFNIIKAINLQSEILERFGGHPQAAGFTVSPENIEQFRDNLLEIADRELSEEDIQKEEIADCEIKLEDISNELLEWIDKLAPFGYGNTSPKFILNNVDLTDITFVGRDANHLRFALLNRDTGEYLKGIGFGLGKEFKDLKSGVVVNLLFALELNEWNGEKSLQLNVKDIRIN